MHVEFQPRVPGAAPGEVRVRGCRASLHAHCTSPVVLSAPRGKPSRALTSRDRGHLGEWLGERVLAGVVFSGMGLSGSLPSPESGPERL